MLCKVKPNLTDQEYKRLYYQVVQHQANFMVQQNFIEF